MMKVDIEKCIGCTRCVHDCIVSDIEMVDGKAHIKNETCIKCGHCIAVCPKDAVSTDDYNMDEVKEYDKESFTVEAENLLNFIKFRRSIRNFKKQDVENEKLLKIIEAGRFTQTGSNSQNVSYIVVKDKLQELRKLVLETLNANADALLANEDMKAFHKYAYMWKGMHKSFLENPDGEDKLFFHAPVLILAVSNDPVNASLASSNMELMTNALGLGTYFSGFLIRAAQTNPKINEFLNIPEGKNLTNCMVIGYPNIKYFRTTPRKEAEITFM